MVFMISRVAELNFSLSTAIWNFGTANALAMPMMIVVIMTSINVMPRFDLSFGLIMLTCALTFIICAIGRYSFTAGKANMSRLHASLHGNRCLIVTMSAIVLSYNGLGNLSTGCPLPLGEV